MIHPLHQLIYKVIRTLCRMIFRVVWRLAITGEENVPKEGGVILACNHRSLADPPLVATSLDRRVHFMAKKELFKFRPIGTFLETINAHPLDRKGSAIPAFKMAHRLLEKGEVLVLFPEGRRSKTEAFGKPKAGVGMIAHRANCPVVPTYIHNSGHLKKLVKIQVIFGKPLYSSYFETYQLLADEVMKQIEGLRSKNGLN